MDLSNFYSLISQKRGVVAAYDWVIDILPKDTLSRSNNFWDGISFI